MRKKKLSCDNPSDKYCRKCKLFNADIVASLEAQVDTNGDYVGIYVDCRGDPGTEPYPMELLKLTSDITCGYCGGPASWK